MVFGITILAPIDADAQPSVSNGSLSTRAVSRESRIVTPWSGGAPGVRAAARSGVMETVSADAPLFRSTLRQAGASRDPLLNGMLIGLGVGAAAGCIWAASAYEPDTGFGHPDFGRGGACAAGALVFGGIGLGAGAGIDALIRRASSHSVPRKQMSVTPAIGGRAAGVSGVVVTVSARPFP